MSRMRLHVSNSEDGSTSEYEVRKSEIFIGTSSTNDVVLYQPSLSGRHLKLRVENGYAEVVDLESRTGTFVNGSASRGAGCWKRETRFPSGATACA